MKRFRCGDVVPGCTWECVGDKEEILRAVTQHARVDHGLSDLSPELLNMVRARSVSV